MSISVSIVSHGHGHQVRELVTQLSQLGDSSLRRVIVTLNVPEMKLAQQLQANRWPFELHLTQNVNALGFGANHNRAFVWDADNDPSTYFGVLNPDLQLLSNPFVPMIGLLQGDGHIGAVYPVQQDAAGRLQDHERLLPTPMRLLWRHLFRARHEIRRNEQPDWVNAACVLFRASAFAQVNGFDEAFYMYCEDVDLCLRLKLAGWRLARAQEAVVVHTAQRASRREWKYVVWHLQSLRRLWRSASWRAYRAQLARGKTRTAP